MIRSELYRNNNILEKTVEIVEALDAVPERELREFLSSKYGQKHPETVIMALHTQGLLYNDYKTKCVLSRVGSKQTMFSNVAFEIFYKLVQSEKDGIDKAKYPIDLQMYVQDKIYHLINLEENGLAKLKYRYCLPQEISEASEVIPVLVSMSDHQKNLSMLRENPGIVPVQSYIFAKAVFEKGSFQLYLSRHEGGSIL